VKAKRQATQSKQKLAQRRIAPAATDAPSFTVITSSRRPARRKEARGEGGGGGGRRLEEEKPGGSLKSGGGRRPEGETPWGAGGGLTQSRFLPGPPPLRPRLRRNDSRMCS